MIDKIVNKKDCTGCNACENICHLKSISMRRDDEGFWYPKVNYSKCIKCNQCVEVCPVINKKQISNKSKAYACFNNNETVRLNSSSGGIFTLIAERVIKKNGVVFGASFNEKFEVVHTYVETSGDLVKLRNSKYVQSWINNAYIQVRTFLERNRIVLFTGTPCQIAGLKNFLGEKYEKLITMDIICHGVPSPMVWQDYVRFRSNVDGAQPRRISFRAKNEGWKRYSVSFNYNNDTEYLCNLKKDLFMRGFLSNLYLRPSCYNCRFKTLNRDSDITLADFWGIEQVCPEMFDDKGTSLVLVNSKKGEMLFDEIRNKMKVMSVDINEAVKHNPSAYRSVSMPSKRKMFFEKYNTISFEKLINECTAVPRHKKIIAKVKSILKKV